MKKKYLTFFLLLISLCFNAKFSNGTEPNNTPVQNRNNAIVNPLGIYTQESNPSFYHYVGFGVSQKELKPMRVERRHLFIPNLNIQQNCEASTESAVLLNAFNNFDAKEQQKIIIEAFNKQSSYFILIDGVYILAYGFTCQ